jgi:hypothetical protein
MEHVMNKMVIYVTARIEVECEDKSLTAQDIVNELEYVFEVPLAGATVVESEIVEFEWQNG